ncbi:MAG TPA: c-type cytochrome [Anaerolineales bacterium]|nr:c-type cytochrome [Anaerolineales bacterium]
MKEEDKKAYDKKYKEAKEKGVPFFPDIVFKDTIVVLIVFIVLVALAYFMGAPLEERANPNDTSYTPRPEWYFLFLFQLLKYFPGNLEVIGAMVLPSLFILLLLILPFIDKSPKRHFMNRPFASISALVVVVGIGALTYLAVVESPPPLEDVVVDQSAALYAQNCANCHGPSIDVPAGADLHEIIAAGNHQGMPAWSGDLSADEIDALVGFILSPSGSVLFTRECSTCHANALLATGNPLELQRVFDEGKNYPPHVEVEIPDWQNVLSADEKNALLNFLAAPDGRRLFSVNCSGCHGQGVAFGGTEEELRALIAKGGQHLEMPAWKSTLSENDMYALATYVVDPGSYPAGATLFGQHCAACHGDEVPSAPDIESARKIIGTGGAHVTMPVWGNILTAEQLDALVKYTFDISKGEGTATGERIFAENCSACHGQFGQGGPNPTLPGDMIAPISSAEYLKTRDDGTIRKIISQGQPNFGMSPFEDINGGELSTDEIDALVAFIRSWEANPPADLPPLAPPAITATPAAPAQQPSGTPLSFSENVLPIFQAKCQVCHSSSNALGGWDATSYESVMTSGDHGPVIVAGDVQNSLLAQFLQGTNGKFMPPLGALPPEEIQAILDWINAGAKNN